MKEPLRVTTSAAYFEAHPESTELWAPGSPLFPLPDSGAVASLEEVREARSLRAVLGRVTAKGGLPPGAPGAPR